MYPAGSGIHQFLFVEPNDLCVTKTHPQLLTWRCHEMEPTLLHSAARAVPSLCPPVPSLRLRVQHPGTACVLYSQPQQRCAGKRKILFHLDMAAPV